MAKSKETFGKKEKEKKKREKKMAKIERKEYRAANSNKGKDMEEMFAYVDENGNLSETPLDPKKIKTIKQENIMISIPKEEDREPEEKLHKGRVSFFNDSKGFGFIKDQFTNNDVFVHINSLSGPIKEKDKVSFEVTNGKKGPEAVNVTVLSN